MSCVGVHVTSVAVAGPTGQIRASLGAAAGRVDGDLPLRLQGRACDGPRESHHPEVCYDRSGYQKGGVHTAAEPAAPVNSAREVRGVPAESERRILHELC